MPTLVEKRDALIADARAIAEKAKSQNRGLTTSEMKTVNTNLDEVQELSKQIKASERSSELHRQLGQLTPGEGGPSITGRVLGLTGDVRTALGRDIAGKMLGTDGLSHRKALLPSGSVVTTVPLAPDPVALGKVPPSLLAALPAVQQSTPVFSFLRQQTRTNLAAPVLPGTQKPTSIYELVKIDTKLEVVAHLSEPIQKYYLEDNTALATFVSSELIFGLNRAVEDQIVNGTGVSPQLDGVLATSGIQTQAAVGDDLLATARSAITRLELVGHTAGLFVFTPRDWERFELSRTTGSGDLELTSPVDRAAQRLWGVQVVVSTALTDGTALLLDRTALAVNVDTAGIKVEWNPWSGFETNTVKARCEGRFQLSIYQPAGCVKITLPAVTP